MGAAFIVFLVFVGIYSFGVASGVFGGDSGDIILSYYFAGVAHPPGYPLNTILGWLFTRIPFGESFAYRANFLSVIYMSATLAVFFLALKNLLRDKIVAI